MNIHWNIQLAFHDYHVECYSNIITMLNIREYQSTK